MISTFAPHNWADVVRFAVSALGVFLVGANLAFIFCAPQLFPRQAVPFWRLFFSAKALLASLFVAVLYSRHGHTLGWRTIGAGTGFLLTLYALGVIWARRPYKYVVVRPELLGAEERAEIVRSLRDPTR